ncbi:Ig-like domain repeat protein [Nocardioides sp. R1-1]|uniref:Ig-like domain repeat protein n=1 Tax=Nocardioides sp. R1-1 TaxID=3383502 RepID=UPI0038D066F0
MIDWRPKIGALGALALVVGTANALAAPAHAETAEVPGTGDVIGWADGLETASYPGPFAQLGDNGLGANAVGAIRADGGVDIVAAAQASAQAVPAHVSGQRTVSLSIGGPRSIWAASEDGTLTKWGGSRGSFPDQTWTPEQLGGKAVAVSGNVYSAYVVVETPEGSRHVTLVAYGTDAIGGVEGVHPVVQGGTGTPLTDVVALGVYNRDPGSAYNANVIALRGDGSLVALSVGQGWYELRPAGDDPVVAFGNQPGAPGTPVGATGSLVTESGVVHGFRLVQPGTTVPWVLETWQDDQFPGVPDGQTVKEVNSTGDTSVGSPQFLLTDQGDVVAWTSEAQAGGGSTAPVPLPASMASGGVLDIADGAYALVAADAAPPLAVSAAPTVSGTPQVGQTLTGTPATFNDATATVTNQWKANDVPIDGATGTTLSLTAAQLGQTITFESTATRGSETLASSSTPVGPVTAAPAPLAVASVPTVSGTPQVGQTLTGNPAVFNDASATVTNQWKANGVAIGGATGSTLALTAAQQGQTITFESTATRGSETLSSSSTPVGPVAAAPVTPPVTPPAPAGKVDPQRPTFTVTKRPTSKKAGRATVVVAGPSAASPVPTGAVKITLKRPGTKRVVTVTLSAGQQVVKLKRLAKGTWKVKVSYLGDGSYNPLTSTATLKVKK